MFKCRTRPGAAVAGDSQFPVQTRTAARIAVNVSRQTRMGPVLLQSGEPIYIFIA